MTAQQHQQLQDEEEVEWRSCRREGKGRGVSASLCLQQCQSRLVACDEGESARRIALLYTCIFARCLHIRFHFLWASSKCAVTPNNSCKNGQALGFVASSFKGNLIQALYLIMFHVSLSNDRRWSFWMGSWLWLQEDCDFSFITPATGQMYNHLTETYNMLDLWMWVRWDNNNTWWDS